MRCYLFACQLPSKNISASCPLYRIEQCAFVMQFVYRMQFPAKYAEYTKTKETAILYCNIIYYPYYISFLRNFNLFVLK